MYINGEPISTYGGVMLGTPRISNAEYSSEWLKMRSRSNFIHLTHTIGLKEIECYVAFLGDTIHEIQMKRSVFRSMLIGKLDLTFTADGFSYFAEYNGDSVLESEYSGGNVSKFKFTAIQHEPLETATGNKVICRSTVPETDCKITVVTPSGTMPSTLTLGTVTINSPVASSTYIADGINGIITKDGTAIAASFVRLPYLVSGVNTFTCPYTQIVEYYPTFL